MELLFSNFLNGLSDDEMKRTYRNYKKEESESFPEAEAAKMGYSSKEIEKIKEELKLHDK